CINDVQRIKKFLIEHGFNESDMIILTDDQKDYNRIPTRANIIKYIKELVSDPRNNDSYFFHFSGHGGQLELHNLLVDPLSEGVRLTVVFDSCHSGTVLDLPYVYSTRGTIKQPKILLQGAKNALDTGLRYFQGELESFRKSVKILATKTLEGHVIRRKNLQTMSSVADIVMFNEQTSADAHEGGQATGAMSYALIKSLSRDHKQTYKELLNSIREILHEKYAQRPQLSASHPMEMESPFTI
ncbi:2226_t:CDS:2, partial [Diversispora eburnea]